MSICIGGAPTVLVRVTGSSGLAYEISRYICASEHAGQNRCVAYASQDVSFELYFLLSVLRKFQPTNASMGLTGKYARQKLRTTA